MGKGVDGVVVDAGHGLGGEEGVDDGFFGGLDRGFEEGADVLVGEHGQLAQFQAGRAGFGGGVGDEDVAGVVVAKAADFADADGHAAREAL